MAVTSYIQLQNLLASISKSVPDGLNCDGCFELLPELAEAQRRGVELSEAMKAVQVHFSQCPCCAYEYETLLEALTAVED